MKRFFVVLNFVAALTGIAFAVYIAMGTTTLADFMAAGGQAPDRQDDQTAVLEKVGVVRDQRLTEISGIDSSYRYPDCFWVHNDSGNAAELFLISKTGHTLAVVQLAGATNEDWEDICLLRVAGRPHIVIADVGDNQARRKRCQLYVLEEPVLELASNGAAGPVVELEWPATKTYRLEFTYPDGAKNCEAIAGHPHNGNLYLVQKTASRASKEKSLGIYKLKLKKNYQLASEVALKVGEVTDRFVTGAAISRDNEQFIFCNYVAANHTKRKPALSWDRQFKDWRAEIMALPLQRQGEAICFAPDGKSVFVVSEKLKQPIWQVFFANDRQAKKKEN